MAGIALDGGMSLNEDRMSEIIDVTAREIFDSRGNPTIEVDVLTASGAIGRAAVPSGASTGMHEAIELRDGDKARLRGKGVLKAVNYVINDLGPVVAGFDACDQELVDSRLIEADGTENKSKYGANAMLGISLAVARAAAYCTGLPLYRYIGGSAAKVLPVPLMNVINGGSHADNTIDVQEFMVVPHGFDTFSLALRAGVEIFHALGARLKKDGLNTAVGDEGGFAPNLKSNQAALDLLMLSIQDAGYKPADQVSIALDAAASEFFDEKSKAYHLEGEGRKLSTQDMISYWQEQSQSYPIVSIEDGLEENDWDGFKALTETLGSRIQLVGDDFFVTNPKFIKKGIEIGACNSVLIKVNQIGTLSETMEAVRTAHRAGWTTVISHRSGETSDTFIADLAVATGSGQIKTGSASRSDRVAKYNQLLRIEEELANTATFGRPFQSRM